MRAGASDAPLRATVFLGDSLLAPTTLVETTPIDSTLSIQMM